MEKIIINGNIIYKEGEKMFIKKNLDENKENFYEDILLQLEVLLDDTQTLTGQLANTSALLNAYMENINWVGFYLYWQKALHLGPFQGLPACTYIKIGQGVCGTAAQKKETIVVQDVHQFPGHIACDGASESEIVLPIFIDDKLFGVLDIDAPIKCRFDDKDRQGLEKIINILSKKLKTNT